MGRARAEVGKFDAERFTNGLTELLASHGLLAIKAHVMVPLDARHHHVLCAEAGVDQLHLDLLEIGKRNARPGGAS